MTDTRNVHGIPYAVRECPICGKTDRLRITDYEFYEELYKKHGGATLHIECERCHLQMNEFSEHGFNYNKKLERLLKKWNTRSGKDD